MTKQHLFPFRGIAVVACVLMGLQACTESEPTSPTAPSILAAKGGGGSDGPSPKVKEAIPNEAPQEITLNVRVIGSGFDDGSVVRFLLAGNSTDKVVVNSSSFESGKELVANVTIALEAKVALYDIEVTTKRGKKGIGSEKFSVKLKGAPSDIPVSATFRDATDDGVLSDKVGSYDSYDAVILPIGNLFLDARRDIPERRLCFDFDGQEGAPDIDCDDAYLSTAAPGVEGGLPEMAPGSDMTTRAQVTWVKPDASGKGYNWFLRFGMDCDSNDVDEDRLDVTHHPDADTWTLVGTTAILCRMPTKGRPMVEPVGTFVMPFELTVTR